MGRPARRPDRTTAVNSGRRRRRACAGNTSGGELLATLATTAGDDRAARTGAHAQPEAVGLGPAAVVRLERALAHEGLPLRRRCTPAGGRARRAGADCAAPPTRKLVAADRPHRSAADRLTVPSEGGRDRPQAEPSIAEVRRGPVAGPGCHPPDPSWSGTVLARARRRAGRRLADLPTDAPGRPAGVVARLWTRLLASPSLRVGRQGSGARADPVVRPTAVHTENPPLLAADQQRRRSVPERAGSRCRSHRPCTACGQRCGA